MICPACNSNLIEKEIEGVKINVCSLGCKGMWFDNFELKKFDEKNEYFPEALLNEMGNVPEKKGVTAKRKCPLDSYIMMTHFFSIKKDVEIDECPKCGGIWLDAGELKTIREQFNDEQDRNAAAKAYFSQMFDKQLNSVHAETHEKQAHAQKFAGFFRFICPSYYIHGKQDGAAF